MSLMKCCHCGGMNSPWDMFLPITQRGSFFQDSFFSGLHQHFETTVKEILSRWSDMDRQIADHMNDVNQHHNDLFNQYRQLRSRNLKEENQAAFITSDDNSRKVVMDVHDFMGGDVKVKVVGEKELVVEGRVDKKDGETSLGSSHSFRRRFSLPRLTNMNAISSVMSSDGILTVTTPKIDDEPQHKTTIIPIQLEESQTPQPLTNDQYECKHCNQQQPLANENAPTSEGRRVPIQMENQITQNSEQLPKGTKIVPIVVEGTETDANQVCSAPSYTQVIPPPEPWPTSSLADDMFQLDLFPGHFFPIMRRGLFFSDTFFQDSWNDFQRAVQEVLSKWGEQPSFGDDFASYRNLRSHDLREDTQAVTSSEDEHQHKFVIDVKDFMDGGEIKVKAVNDREVVVEGHLKKAGEGAQPAKRFLRRFAVPGDIQLDGVTSVMSSDGVLTITAPKKISTVQIEEVFSPICAEGDAGKIQFSADRNATNAPGNNNVSMMPSGTNASSSAPQPAISKQFHGPQQTHGANMGVQLPSGSTMGKGTGSEDSTKPKSFSAKGKGVKVPECEEENVDYMAALKPRSDGTFPIKISGTVINSNAV